MQLTRRGRWNLWLTAFAGLLVVSCQRETRNFEVAPPAADLSTSLRVSELSPGPRSTNTPLANPYEKNAYAMAEGKRLFLQFNCVGCHSHGGGGMGPALMDEKWIYGSNPDQIFATIIQGRPNGMPSFGGKVPEYQVWQLAAYVRSLSGLAAKGAAPGRNDEISGKKPENSAQKEKPIEAGAEPSPGSPP